MLCPKCKTELTRGVDKQFETLCDHVCDPNDEDLPVRPTFVCPNKSCVANEHELFWSDYGEGPYNSKSSYDYQWIDNNPGPFDSHERAAIFNISYRAENKLWKNRWFMITKDVHYESNPHGDKVGRYTKYHLWIRNKNGQYPLYTSGIHMFLYCVRKFRESHDKLFSAKDAVYDVTKYKRTEWWRKALVWYIRIFYRNVYKKVVQS